MTILSVDIETYSDQDLKKVGVYRYAEDPSFRVLLFGYALDQGPVKVVDLACGEKLPDEILEALWDPAVTKTAYNANFERTCLEAHFGQDLPPEQWECTAVLASSLGLPLSLEQVAKVLKLPQQKSAAGTALIKYFSCPCRATKANGGRTRNLPIHDMVRWAEFSAYCRQDVEVERAIRQRLWEGSAPDHDLWCLDQAINDRGVQVDTRLMDAAIKIDQAHQEKLLNEARALTGLENPNSVSQLKNWLFTVKAANIESLNKDALAELAKDSDDEVRRLGELRQEMAKTSVKKYEAMKRSVCKDERVRALFQFNGANRTGRWAGRLVQVQNLPGTKLPDLDLARELVMAGQTELIDLLYGSIPDTLSQLIRTAFIPAPGYRFIVADFSAIEARIIAWLAREDWRLEVFRTHGKIYEASAAKMFKIPIDEVTKPQRQKGKIAELALGYGGSVGALTAMGALKMGLEESELRPLVDVWRRENSRITALWWEVEHAAFRALAVGSVQCCSGLIRMYYRQDSLRITLPSGRNLVYREPREGSGKFGGPCITYMGLDQTTKQWRRLDTYGPKLVENIVQGIARDCLAEAMLRVNAAHYRIVMHVHDELVLEVLEGRGSLNEVCQIMSQELPWAQGLPLGAAGFESHYYKKD